MNDHVDSAFRSILAGVTPPKRMVSERDDSRKILEDAADLLCRNDEQRQILQNVYMLGKQDGWIEGGKTKGKYSIRGKICPKL